MSLSMVVIVIMVISMPLFPRRPRRSIILTITITVRVARALITRLVDPLGSVVYAADYVPLVSSLKKNKK
jgi:hypothetical protein